MTHDVLQSDIDLTRRLIDSGLPTTEIVTALGFRGIDSNRANQLIADLQSGKPVEPDKPIKINLSQKPVGKEVLASESGPGRRPGSVAQSVGDSTAKGRKSTFPWFTIIALASAAVCVCAVMLISRKSHSPDSIEQKQSSASDDSTIPGNQRSPSHADPKAISIGIEPNGLRLCGNSITRENFLTGIFEILGPPSRTNQVEKADHIIYAYDSCGLLVFSPKDSGHRSLVLDFDGSDGDAGTKKAFVGAFKVNNHVVQANTDAATLGLIKELDLQAPKSASGIFHAQYGKLDLVFGYLKTPERLSLVEIDFN
jgi:hypothetical protein